MFLRGNYVLYNERWWANIGFMINLWQLASRLGSFFNAGANSGLVKLVVMNNVFFNRQQNKIKLNGSYALNR